MADEKRKHVVFGFALVDGDQKAPECAVGIGYNDLPNSAAMALEKMALEPDVFKPFIEALQAFLPKGVALGERLLSASAPKKDK